MPLERIVGIDFGTSTSVVKIKTYKDNEPLGSANAVEYVHFDNKASIPTLVYTTNEGKYLIGYEAENAAQKGVLHQNFKLNLISLDEALREEAILYTTLFFQYMYKNYDEQKTHFPACNIETTYVSYPAKWPEELRQLMLGFAEKAGFKNVKGMDEPTAAIHTVMVQQNEILNMGGQDYVNILMIDMGAGTTDLVLCRYSPYDDKQITVLNTWPKANSNSFFGGREIDEAICDYVKAYLIDCGLPNTKNFNEKYLDKCKIWKETNLSPIFNDKNGVVKYCGFIDTLLAMLDVEKDFPPMTRTDFENMLKNYLSQYPQLITDCLNNVGFPGDQVDYVVLTGGHSQWYFTSEILEGKITRFGVPELPKIKNDPQRIINLSIPQETVAIGLVLQKIAIKRPDRPSIKVTGIINMVLSKCIEETGIDLLTDKVALTRLEEAAKKAVSELATAEKTTMYIPYITANSNGPLHLTKTITRTELNTFILRYENNTAKKNDINKNTGLSDEQIRRNTNINGNEYYNRNYYVVKDNDQNGNKQAEKLCAKCGKKILVTSAFCCYCGNKNTDTGNFAEPAVIYCRTCGNRISSNLINCNYCGALIPKSTVNTIRQTTLLIKREMQFVCSAVFYKVVVDGIDYGNINIGQSKQIYVTSQIVSVEIICTTVLLTHYKASWKLRLGNNPSINFKIQYPAEIIPIIIDAEILEKY